MVENGEAPSTEGAHLDKSLLEQDVKKEECVSSSEDGQVKEEKKTSDAILDELFSSIRESGTVVDVAEVITEVSRSRRERATRDKSRSRSRSRDRKHKHKKNKKEKKPKKHRSRSRSNDRKRRHRSNSSSPRLGKTGTLADITINTKSKNLDDLRNTVPVSATFSQDDDDDDDDDDLPVGADYRTVMAEAVASSQPSTSQGPSLADIPTAKKMQPAFPLKKSDREKRDPIEEKSSSMLKKVISEKGGAFLVPRKIQIDASKNNGNSVDSFGPAPPPVVKDESNEDEEEDVEMTPTLTVKTTTKISFGQISLKVNGGAEKEEEGNGVKKDEENEKMEVDENVKEEAKTEEKIDEKEKKEKAAKKMAVRRRRSTSVEESKKKEKKERKRSRSRSKDRKDRDRSRDKGRDGRRDAGRSNERRGGGGDRRDERRRRSRSRSAERRRDDRLDRDRRGRRSRSREQKRSRSRERSKSREKIDKKKLLEIALQNSRGVSGPVAEKQGVNMKILEKAGGRNIGDIVSYCQKLSETENAEKLTGGRGDSDDDDFSYRSKKEIKMNIPGSKQLPTSTPQERLLDTAPLRAAFPVSSGAIHRDNTKESRSEWKKVDASAAIPSVCTSVQKKLVATSSLNKIKAESEGRSIPMSSFPILPPPPAPPNLRGDLIPPPPPPPIFNHSSLMPPPPMPPTIITPSYDRLIHMPDSGYDEDSRSVGRTMEDRSKMVNRLIRDPNDTDAMKRLGQIDESLNNYGKNAELSGRWMGHTRVNLLSGDELQPHDPRYHAWVKKDLFKNTVPMVGGVGMKLMQKMGWNIGEGLGRENQGDTQPLTLDVKSDRRGLYAEGYDIPISKGKSKGAKKSGGVKVGGIGSNGGGGTTGGGGGGGQSEEKNPISAMMELTQSKRWDPPVFDYQTRGGMTKTFTCSVKLNGFEFIGPVCLSKKAAKTECARVALEKIGFAAPNVQTPTIYDPSSSYSIPEQIVQARVRSALEAAELSAMPPPPSYIAPLEIASLPREKYDPSQIQAMQEQREKEKIEKAAEPQPVPPPAYLMKEKEKPAEKTIVPPKQQGGRGRGGRGRGRGGGMERGGYYPDGPYPPPPHMMRGGGPPHGHYPPFHHHPNHHPGMGYGEMEAYWGNEPHWEEDFTEDLGNGPNNPSSIPYGEYPPQHRPPSYSSFPSNSFANVQSARWTPDDEFGSGRGGGGGPPFHPPNPHNQYGRPPMMNGGGHREHSPAFEPYENQQRYFH